MIKNKINKELLKKEIESIRNELIQGYSFYLIACGLKNSSDYENEFKIANTFWSCTHTALMDSAILRLCRVYDKNEKVTSLINLIKHYNEFIQNIDKELNSSKNNSLIKLKTDEILNSANYKILIRWRSNVIAHKNNHLISDNPNFFNSPLKDKIIISLVDDAFEIINKISKLLFDEKSHIASYYLEINDYKRVLEKLKNTSSKD